MKKSNDLQLNWIKLNLLKLSPTVVTIVGWEAQELFSLPKALRTRFSSETHESFVDYICQVLSEHIESTENTIDFTERFNKFRKIFKIN